MSRRCYVVQPHTRRSAEQQRPWFPSSKPWRLSRTTRKHWRGCSDWRRLAGQPQGVAQGVWEAGRRDSCRPHPCWQTQHCRGHPPVPQQRRFLPRWSRDARFWCLQLAVCWAGGWLGGWVGWWWVGANGPAVVARIVATSILPSQEQHRERLRMRCAALKPAGPPGLRARPAVPVRSGPVVVVAKQGYSSSRHDAVLRRLAQPALGPRRWRGLTAVARADAAQPDWRAAYKPPGSQTLEMDVAGQTVCASREQPWLGGPAFAQFTQRLAR